MARRILIFTNHFYPENFKVNEIADTLNDGVNEIEVITCVPNYPSGIFPEGYGFFTKNKERKKNMTIRRLPVIPRGNGSTMRIVANYFTYFLSTLFYTFYISIFRKRFDVVFVHHTSPIMIAISPILYKIFNRKSKLILWDLDIWPDTLKAVGAVKSERILSAIESVVRFIYSWYDHILVGSMSFVKIVEGRVRNVGVSYFPNWAEDVFINREITSPSEELSFPEGLKIMFAGNMGTAQDIENIFECAKLLKDEKIRWLFVGDGRMRKWLEDKVNSGGLSDKFVFYGNNPIKMMPYFFSKADVMLVSLKDREIFKQTVPAKIQAYMAFEKPVIGMLSGEGAELINESAVGWVSNSGDVESFAKNVKTILAGSDEELLLRAKNGKRYFDEYFRKELRFEQLAKIFEM
ncbi:MAG: glycosyltransferase involved in cell wall biosynthesis [Glaciecola sp.]